ncbi:MAG: hypothetical protein IKJ66_09270 [Bacteroidaceae bacterium]|jgi:hypothetical protein|nr:hypothetical protein [Bacteroidaceae bacterium]
MMNSIFLIGVCVIMPIIVVWLNNRTSQNETNKKTEILLKSIESGASIDPEFLKSQHKEKSLKEKLLGKLTGACIVTAVGISLCIAILVLSLVGYTDSFIITNFTIFGCVAIAVGIGLFISYFVGKRMLANELKAEEESLNNGK